MIFEALRRQLIPRMPKIDQRYQSLVSPATRRIQHPMGVCLFFMVLHDTADSACWGHIPWDVRIPLTVLEAFRRLNLIVFRSSIQGFLPQGSLGGGPLILSAPILLAIIPFLHTLTEKDHPPKNDPSRQFKIPECLFFPRVRRPLKLLPPRCCSLTPPTTPGGMVLAPRGSIMPNGIHWDPEPHSAPGSCDGRAATLRHPPPLTHRRPVATAPGPNHHPRKPRRCPAHVITHILFWAFTFGFLYPQGKLAPYHLFTAHTCPPPPEGGI